MNAHSVVIMAFNVSTVCIEQTKRQLIIEEVLVLVVVLVTGLITSCLMKLRRRTQAINSARNEI